MTDTSKEAVDLLIQEIEVDAVSVFDDTIRFLRALTDERDALRAQLQAARDEALEEAAKIVVDEGKEALKYSSEVIAKTYCDDAALKIRALKSTSAEGEG